MTRVVYKYPIEDFEVTVTAADQETVLVGIDPKLDRVCVWIEHSLDLDGARPVQYRIVGTGIEIGETGVHVGSCITADGYVWHVYAKTLR